MSIYEVKGKRVNRKHLLFYMRHMMKNVDIMNEEETEKQTRKERIDNDL